MASCWSVSKTFRFEIRFNAKVWPSIPRTHTLRTMPNCPSPSLPGSRMHSDMEKCKDLCFIFAASSVNKYPEASWNLLQESALTVQPVAAATTSESTASPSNNCWTPKDDHRGRGSSPSPSLRKASPSSTRKNRREWSSGETMAWLDEYSRVSKASTTMSSISWFSALNGNTRLKLSEMRFLCKIHVRGGVFSACPRKARQTSSCPARQTTASVLATKECSMQLFSLNVPSP
mmetsp:Transcript_16249/g.48326  ORF Transcript_16249/g.48326 Transcript_16249/m.48326 type:complete len:232 (-) Transcript_16249:1821-2516(-)